MAEYSNKDHGGVRHGEKGGVEPLSGHAADSGRAGVSDAAAPAAAAASRAAAPRADASRAAAPRAAAPPAGAPPAGAPSAAASDAAPRADASRADASRAGVSDADAPRADVPPADASRAGAPPAAASRAAAPSAAASDAASRAAAPRADASRAAASRAAAPAAAAASRADASRAGVSDADAPSAAPAASGESPLGKIKLRNAIYPILIGLIVVGLLFWRDFNPAVLDDINFSWISAFWLFLAFLCMFGRDLGYIIRIRVLSDGQLSWRQAFRVIMLWEFTSAITPSAVGGTSVAILYVHKEGISVGRSSAIVMLTSFLDELYFIIMFPLIMAIVGMDNLFDITMHSGFLATSLMTFAFIGYAFKLAWVLVLSYGLFVNPRGLKWLLMKIFKLRFLRRWYRSVNVVGSDIIASSREIRSKGFGFWMRSLASTLLSWSSRYLVANALIMAFFSVSDHVLLFARQLVMWIMMLVMPTPGGSGVAEWMFTKYCADLIDVPVALQAGAAALIAFFWRGITYYPYLAIGAVMLPRWVGRSFRKPARRTKQ